MRSRSSSTTTAGDAKRLLLVREIRVVDRRDACFVALGKHTPQLGTSGPYPPGTISAALPRSTKPISPPSSIPQRRRNSAGTLVWPRCETFALLVADM